MIIELWFFKFYKIFTIGVFKRYIVLSFHIFRAVNFVMYGENSNPYMQGTIIPCDFGKHTSV